MELRQLKTFRTVANLLNFHQAAHVLHYSQSAVSAQIHALEEDLNIRLFDRLPKRIMLTEAGRRLLQYTDKMLSLAEETRSEVTGGKSPHGSLNIRIPETLAAHRLPKLLKPFRNQFPKVQLIFSTCAYHSLEQDLSKGIYDLAFLLTESYQAPNLSVKLLGVEPLVIATAPKHRLARKKAVYPKDLEGETFLFTRTECSYRRNFERMLAEENVETIRIININSIEAIKQCIKEGVGISVLPEITVRKEINNKEFIPLNWAEGHMETASLMIWHNDKWISPALNAFMSMAGDFYSNHTNP
ncbi:MAG TPA: LysR family transcriptional regulator [Deltaproteobacteria bacterium]|nr:LysR family transcriptional regulator [Deltaproteobacteria bacterium]